MMPQMESNQPAQERPGSSYGAYTGDQGVPPQYTAPDQQSTHGAAYDDNFVEAVAERIALYLKQRPDGKVHGQASNGGKLTAEQRTAVAIISILALIPLGIVLGQAGLGAIIALGIVAIAIFLVNAAVNGVL